MSLGGKQIDELRAYAKDRKGEIAKLVSDAADTIELLSAKLSAANMERSSQYYHDGWIPVSERLPDEDYWTGANFQYSADVLMTVYNAEDEETIIDYGHTANGSWYSDTTDGLVPPWWKVLAWMPLPEPYKEGEET